MWTNKDGEVWDGIVNSRGDQTRTHAHTYTHTFGEGQTDGESSGRGKQRAGAGREKPTHGRRGEAAKHRKVLAGGGGRPEL